MSDLFTDIWTLGGGIVDRAQGAVDKLAGNAPTCKQKYVPPHVWDRPVVRCGVAVVCERDGKVLMHERKGSHGAGTWSFIGGWQELGESFEDAGAREALEETGLIVSGLKIVDTISTMFPESGIHAVTVLMEAANIVGEPVVREPDKIRGNWEWVELKGLKLPLFRPLTKSQWVLRRIGA